MPVLKTSAWLKEPKQFRPNILEIIHAKLPIAMIDSTRAELKISTVDIEPCVAQLTSTPSQTRNLTTPPPESIDRYVPDTLRALG